MSNPDVATTSEMDYLDQLGAQGEGYLVRKDLVRKYSRQYPVPTYVVEFLLGRYCASTDPAEIERGCGSSRNSCRGARSALEKKSCSRLAPVISAASRSSTSFGPSSTPEAIPMPQRCPASRSKMPDRRRTGARQRAHAHRWLLCRGLPGIRPGDRTGAQRQASASPDQGQSRCLIPTCWECSPKAGLLSPPSSGATF